MSTLVTHEAPDFEANAVMPGNSIEKLRLTDFRGKHLILFFYPKGTTSICASEVIAFNNELDKFKARGCEVIGVSVDSESTHQDLKHAPMDEGGVGDIRFPLVSDSSKEISRTYGVLFDESVALRGLFLIDKEGIVRHSLVNDLPLGRSVDETLRIIDALQFHENYGGGCPANWRPE